MTADGASAHWTSERVARRLTAILAADVAGYSRLMGADEEGTLAQLKARWRTPNIRRASRTRTAIL
jgi:class 3 adenylate cyclase